MSWLAAALGLLARSPEAANGPTFLPYASGAFVPVHTMPQWLHGFAGIALAWCCGILGGSIALSGILFSRRTS